MAQKRRTAQQKKQAEKRRQQRITLLCILGGICVIFISLGICLLVFPQNESGIEDTAPISTAMPYNANEPFSVSDLTGAQLLELREKGRIRVSDGPRGISIGDSLEKILERYPSTYSETEASMEQTGEQSDEQMILYCSAYYRNNDGKMTALPPRGLLNVDSGSITITLLAPISPYPAGTTDDYGRYEHVYCIYTIDPETMTVSSIVLGIDR